ncbi:MAG: amidohydrolase family protein [Proteobacteria bacterium]|nr:amidohydrolase family protein [Pseudomonadota bacterium]
MMKTLISLAAILFWLTPAFAQAQDQKRPIFDTHMHYSHDAWDVYTPAQILEKMDKAGVTKALVSSRPDDGTMKMLEAAPDRIVAGFRPYKVSTSLASWHSDPDLLAYSEPRLAKRQHRVFGEIHINTPENLETPEMKRYLEIVAEQGLIVQPHTDAAMLRVLFAKAPNLRILWAHAGFTEPASVVGAMLDQYPNLWTETSFRAGDIMAGGGLSAEWKALFIRHADRFMIGTDTWVVDRWHEYGGLIGEHRAWLELLPADVAEKIAYKNAEKMFPPTGN